MDSEDNFNNEIINYPFSIINYPFYNFFGIIPLMPISIICSLFGASGLYLLLPSVSVHSKLLLFESETSILISLVSLPVIINGVANAPVTTQDPAGTADVANKGLGTVVAPTGAWPVRTDN